MTKNFSNLLKTMIYAHLGSIFINFSTKNCKSFFNCEILTYLCLKFSELHHEVTTENSMKLPQQFYIHDDYDYKIKEIS